jgi:hypothetical protein
MVAFAIPEETTMLPLFDMLANAQNGNAIEQMARQFGISQSQTEAALEALMPAFSTGLKRNASDPMGVGGFLEALSGGQHAKYFEDMSKAFSPAGVQEGNGILGHLFGSREVSRAVAAQAAQATGIGQEILKQMLPVIASMMMGGLFKQSTGQMNAASSGAFGAAGGNVIGQVIEQMMRQQQRAPQPPAAPRNPNPLDNPFGQVLEQMFGGGTRRAPEPEPEPKRETAYNPMNPMGADNPFGRIFEEMMGGGLAKAQQPQGRQPEPKPEPKKNAGDPYDDLFGEMFETGRKTQEQYQRSMESIFDQYLEGMQRRR